MKKLTMTIMLVICVATAAAGKSSIIEANDGAISDPAKFGLCHNKDGSWNPTSKTCDPNSCGCLFHQIAHFIGDLFE